MQSCINKGDYYYHERMCRVHVHLWSRFDINIWHQGLIYRILSCIRVRLVTFVCFDIGIPYLAQGSITVRGYVAYIQDPDTTLSVELDVKMGFMTWLCFFLSFVIFILCLARECITMVQCVAHFYDLCMTLTFDLNIKIYVFTMNLSLERSSLLSDKVIPNSGTWLFYHETTCSVHS